MFLHYRKKYNLYSIVVLFRRFILSLLISVIRVNSVLSFGLVSAVLVYIYIYKSYYIIIYYINHDQIQVVSITINHIVQPFRTVRDNHLETLTLLAALFAYTLAFTLSIDELDYGAIPIVVFYFSVNVGIVIWCALEFIYGQVPRARALIDSWKK